MSSGIPIHHLVEINLSTVQNTVQTQNFGILLGVHTHEVDDPQRVHGPYSSYDSLAADFVGETEILAWAAAVFGVANPIRQVKVGRIDAMDADLTASLAAILGEDADFYYTTIESRAEADILEAATWIEAQTKRKILLAQTGDAAVKAATAGNVMLDLQTAARHRTACMYNVNSVSTDGSQPEHAYRDGAWAARVGRWSLDTHSPPWGTQILSGQVGDTFTETEVTNIEDANGNLFAPIDGFGPTPYTWPGKMASGRSIRAQTAIDWIERRSQEAIARLRINEAQAGRTIGMDLAGQGLLENALRGVLGVGYSAGHLDRDRPTVLTVPALAEISASDFANGIMRFSAEGQIRKTVEKFVLDFVVQT